MKKKQTKKVEQEQEYVVLHDFKDLKDGNKVYRKGDSFNIKGKPKNRIKELSSRNNNADVRLIGLKK